MFFRTLKGHCDDVSRFVVKDGLLVSGGRDATLVGWRAETGEFLFAKRYCHGGEVSAVDTAADNHLVLTGSRDKSVKVWALHDMNHENASVSPSPKLVYSCDLGDRIWSLACDPRGNRAIVGSAGLGGVPALHLLNLETLKAPEAFGDSVLKKGAGVLDIQWLDDNTFLSCGYDTCARMWDVRAGACVRSWEEPFDEAVYCFSTDNAFTLVCGTARHGLVRLWDMRASGSGQGPAPAGRKKQQHVSMFYARPAYPRQSSPVYSVAFDQANLYVALDQCLNLLSFSGDGSRTNNQLIAQPCRQQYQQHRQKNYHHPHHNQRQRVRRH